MNDKDTLTKLDEAVFGNGKPGIKTDLEVLKVEFCNMKDDIRDLATSYKALARTQIEFDVTEKMKINLSEKRMKMLERVSIVFGISIPLTALIISIL